jgi:hypothetical protein
MKKRNLLTACAAVVMVLQLVATTGAAMAQDPEVTFGFTPISGLPGTKVTFTGTGCPHDATKTRDGLFLLTRDGSTGTPVDFVSDASGNFTGQYDTTSDAPGTYTTVIQCLTTNKGGVGSPFTVTAPAPPPPPPPPPAPPGSTYFPVPPVRLLDTRNGTGAPAIKLGPGGVLDLKVTDVAGIPATGVTAVALNVTATNASGPLSWITVWPTGTPQPNASNLNFDSGVSVPNLVIARVGTGGTVSIANANGALDVVADLQGWYSDTATGGAKYVPLNPQRILDTREGVGAAKAQVGPGATVELGVTGLAGVPAEATAVVLNMTVDRATGPESFLTVWPSGSSMPNASSLNFSNGHASTNLVIARVGAGGKVAVANSVGATDVIADVQGWFAPPASATGSTYFPVNPARILDSRNGTGTPGGAVGQLGTQGTIDLTVVGVGGVPLTGVAAVVLNMTVTESPGPESYLTVFPAGTARPNTSNLNFVAGQTVPNLVIVRVVDGKVSIFNNVGSTNVIADVQGWFGG